MSLFLQDLATTLLIVNEGRQNSLSLFVLKLHFRVNGTFPPLLMVQCYLHVPWS